MDSEERGDDSLLETNLRQKYALLPNEEVSTRMITSDKDNPRSWSVTDVHDFLSDKGLSNAADRLSTMGITGNELLRQDMSRLVTILEKHDALEIHRVVNQLRDVDTNFRKIKPIQSSIINKDLPPIPRPPKTNVQINDQLAQNRRTEQDPGFFRNVWTEKTDPHILSRLPKDIPRLQNSTGGMQGKQCYRCNEWGHVQRFCPMTMYCSTCRQHGHSTSSCRKSVPYCYKCAGNHSRQDCLLPDPGGLSPTPSPSVSQPWRFEEAVKDYASKFMEIRLQNSKLNQMKKTLSVPNLDFSQVSNPSEQTRGIDTSTSISVQQNQNSNDILLENFEDGAEVVGTTETLSVIEPELEHIIPDTDSQQVLMPNQVKESQVVVPTGEDSTSSENLKDSQIPVVQTNGINVSIPTTTTTLNQDMDLEETPLTEPILPSVQHGENFLNDLDLSKKLENPKDDNICQANETEETEGVIDALSPDVGGESSGRKVDGFICSDCEKSFNTKRSLSTHVKQHHPIGIISNPTTEKPLPPRKSTLRRLGTTGPTLQMDEKSSQSDVVTKSTRERTTKTRKKNTLTEPVITHEENGSVKISLGEKEWEWSDEDVQLQPITNHKEAIKVTKKLLCHLVGHPQQEHDYWGSRTLKNGICNDTIRIVTWWVARQDGSRRTHLDPKTGQIVVETLDTCIQNLRNGISQMCNQAEIALRGANRREERRKDSSVRRKDIPVRSRRNPSSATKIASPTRKSQKTPLVLEPNIKIPKRPTTSSQSPSSNISSKRRKLKQPLSPSISTTDIGNPDLYNRTTDSDKSSRRQDKDDRKEEEEIKVHDMNNEESREPSLVGSTTKTKIHQEMEIPNDEEKNELPETIQVEDCFARDDEEDEIMVAKPDPLPKPNPKTGSSGLNVTLEPPLSSPSTSLVEHNSRTQNDLSNIQSFITPQPTPVGMEEIINGLVDFATRIANAATLAVAEGLNSNGVASAVVAAALASTALSSAAAGGNPTGVRNVVNSVAAAAIAGARLHQINSSSGFPPDRNVPPALQNNTQRLMDATLNATSVESVSDSVGEEDVLD